MAEFFRRIPKGDNRERMICADSGPIAYKNPKVVVGLGVFSLSRIGRCR
jgi:hypothetical protein